MWLQEAPGGNRRRKGQPDTGPGCGRRGQPGVHGQLERPGQGRVPPEGPSSGASDRLQLRGRLQRAFLEKLEPPHWAGGLLSSASSSPSLPSLLQEMLGNKPCCPFLGLLPDVGSAPPSMLAVPRIQRQHPLSRSRVSSP